LVNPYKLSKYLTSHPVSDSKKTAFNLYLNKKNDVRTIESLLKKINISPEELVQLIKEKDRSLFIPLSVFNNNLAPLEAVVLFLKDSLGFTLHKIASHLDRDDRTIWLTHSNAVKKGTKLTVSSKHLIPLELLSDRRFSILESVVAYCKEKENLSTKQISRLTSKSPKTIWTVYDRMQQKRGLKDE